MEKQKKKTALVTGSAGFIGYHISKRLLDEGWRVVGVDCMSNYYDVSLKERRENILMQSVAYRSVHEKIESPNFLMSVFEEERPVVVIHLAAQAGVRYSIENPRAYLESNINGTFELLEAARAFPPEHMLLASTSSAYGANVNMPYQENMRTDHQVSFYAATKKATENMGHSYAHLFDLPITMFRFFTVYGPWGRPDMAPMKFADAIINGNTINIFNHGEMERDFTYIDDLTEAVYRLLPAAPCANNEMIENDSKSAVAPFRVVNIGNSNPVELMHFVTELEKAIGKTAHKNFMPMQPGDVLSTWADVKLLHKLTGYVPSTKIREGVRQFIDWYKSYLQQ